MADGRIRLNVAAGESWDALVAACVADGLAGVEALSGIPGSVGATPIQNVGAYGQEVADVLIAVRALDRVDRRAARRSTPRSACSTTARASSSAIPGRWVVLGVSFALEPTGVSEPIRYAELAAPARRRARRARAGRRGARGGARAAPRQGHGARPRRSRHRQRRLVLHEPDPRARDFDAFAQRAAERLGADATPPAWPVEPRARQDVGRLAHRARRLPSRLRQPGRHRDLLQAHARADQPRRRDDRRARRARARDRRRRARGVRRRARARAGVRRARAGSLRRSARNLQLDAELGLAQSY